MSAVIGGEHVSAIGAVLSDVMNQVIDADGRLQLEQQKFWQDVARKAGEALIPEGFGRFMNVALTQFVVTFAVAQVRIGFWGRLISFLKGKGWNPPPRFRLVRPTDEDRGFGVRATIARDGTGRWVASWNKPPVTDDSQARTN